MVQCWNVCCYCNINWNSCNCHHETFTTSVLETIWKAPLSQVQITSIIQNIRSMECWYLCICTITKILRKLLPHARFHWNRAIGCWSMAKNDFSNGGRLSFWILEMFIFGHLIVIEFQMCCCVLNFIKIRWFFVEICGDLMICHIADIGHLEFLKFKSLCQVSSIAMLFCLSVQNFT